MQTEEQSVSHALNELCVFLDPKKGVIKTVRRIYEYSDDPKFYNYGAILTECSPDKYENELSNSTSGFSFFSEEEALLKCLGESLERDAVRRFQSNNFITGSVSELQENVIDIKSIVTFSNSQFLEKRFSHVQFNDKTPFSWIKGKNEMSNKEVLIPAQLVYLSYKPIEKEKYIYLPTTSGLAGGGTYTSALVRSILENIERDSFLLHYLSKKSGMKINLSKIKSKKVQKLVSYIRSYNLEVVCCVLMTELEIPTYLTIIINRTGVGPALSLGMKTDLNPVEAILGSIQEALHTRGWIRNIVEKEPGRLINVNLKRIEKLDDRAILWYGKDKIELLDFFINGGEKELEVKEKNFDFKSKLSILKNALKKNNMDLFSINVTPRYLDKYNFKVVKSIIPQLQPFYLIEEYPCWGGDRLRKLLGTKNINKFPQPFL